LSLVYSIHGADVKRIVFVHLFNDRSGSPKVLSQVARLALRKNFDVEILTSDHADGFLTDFSCKRKVIFYKRSENKLLTLWFYILSQVFLFLSCLRYFRKDVVFYVNTMMPFAAGLAAFLMGKRVIYHVHEVSIRPVLLKSFLRAVIRLTADDVVFVSNYLRGSETFSGINQVVVYNALDFFPDCCSDRKVSEDFRVLMVCSLKEYKGVSEFLEVASRFVGKGRYFFDLVLNADQVEIDVLMGNRFVPPNVCIYSRQSDLDKFYRNSHLLLSLTRHDVCVETFGLTILEAMSYSLPVIVPPVGGPAEIVRDGKEGFLISCYKIDEISAAINKLSNNHDIYKAMSKNARIRADDFSLKKFEDGILSVISP